MNQPTNKRSRTTGTLELRKLWSVPEAKFIYALYVEYEQQTYTGELEENIAPTDEQWESELTTTETGFTNPQGYLGDEEWARTTAEHFEIEFPEEEFKL